MRKFFAAVLAVVMSVCALAIGCKNKPTKGDITVYMPDGAPAIAFSGLMQADTEEDGVSYRVVSAKAIVGNVTYRDMAENADLCVLPLTDATASIGSGTNYQMIGAVTHGNLYMISQNDDTLYTADNLSLLVGKTVGVLQLASTPGLIFKTVLTKCGVPFADVSGGGVAATDKVNLRSFSEPSEISVLQQSGIEVFVLAEPAVRAQASKGFACVGDIQAMYGEGGYPQAVLVAKKSLIEEKGEWLDGFLADLNESIQWALSASGEEIVAAVTAHLEDENYATTLKAKLLTGDVVARCGVRFEDAQSCKAKTQAFLRAAKQVDSKTVLPATAFYRG